MVLRKDMSARRTYWHLEPHRRKPTDYEICSSRLFYHLGRGFEVETPVGAWCAKTQSESHLSVDDWDAYEDPRQTTYAKYVELQKTSETFVDGLLGMIEGTDYDRRLRPQWLALLERLLPTLRYPIHGLQMVASYLAHMAPSGRIVITGLFQTADEIRRIQRFAYRMRQLQLVDGAFGADSRSRWQAGAEWQPLRRLIENLLVTYDWGEAFAALNLVAKPMFDDMFMVQLAQLADREGDDLLNKMLLSLHEDCRWHRAWSAALAHFAVERNPANQRVLAGWIERWTPEAKRALEPLRAHLGGAP
jgi:toluene monooxygenase system protein E